MPTLIEGVSKKSWLDSFFKVSLVYFAYKRYIWLRLVKKIQFLIFLGKTSGFLGPKRGILDILKKNSEKSWIFSQNFFYFFFSIFLYQNALKLISGMNSNFFYHISLFNQLKQPYLAFIECFSHFYKKNHIFAKIVIWRKMHFDQYNMN